MTFYRRVNVVSGAMSQVGLKIKSYLIKISLERSLELPVKNSVYYFSRITLRVICSCKCIIPRVMYNEEKSICM